MSKLSLSVAPTAKRALATASTPAEVKEIETLAAAAKRYAQSLEDRNFAAEMQLRAGRKGGQMLIEMADSGKRAKAGDNQHGGNGALLPSLAELGIEPMRSSRWQWLARQPEAAFEAYIERTKAEAEPLTAAGLAPLMSSDTAEWYTPSHVLDAVMATMGGIDLDPCAEPGKSVPAATHFTADDDGLSQPWRGRIYMNPPYGTEIGAWVDKLAEEFEYRNVINAEKPRGSEHPYEKPVALWQYLFDRLPPGLVVDPFAGTGASGVAARLAGHRWIGIEIEERYCEIAATRCSQEVLGLVG